VPASPGDPTLDPERARAAIELACPALRSATVVPLGRGWDHDVYLAGDRWVFRFPRNQTAAAALLVEERLLPWLSPRLPLPIPTPACVGTFGETGWPFARHELLPGATICDAGLDAAARTRLAVPLARFVRALHAVPLADAPCRLEGDPLGRFDVGRRAGRTLDRLNEWRSGGILPPDAASRLARFIEEAPPTPPADVPVIVHADLHTRNLLVGSDGALSGVIDWVDLHGGQRALDLAAAFEVFPAGGREAFCAEYGGVPDATIAWARWRAIDHTAAAFAGALEREDSRFAGASRQALIEMAEG